MTTQYWQDLIDGNYAYRKKQLKIMKLNNLEILGNVYFQYHYTDRPTLIYYEDIPYQSLGWLKDYDISKYTENENTWIRFAEPNHFVIDADFGKLNVLNDLRWLHLLLTLHGPECKYYLSIPGTLDFQPLVLTEEFLANLDNFADLCGWYWEIPKTKSAQKR